MAKIRKIKLKYVKIFSNIICWFVLNVGSTESFAAPFSIRSLTCSAVNPSLYEGKRRITLSDDFCVLFFFYFDLSIYSSCGYLDQFRFLDIYKLLLSSIEQI